MLKPWRLSILLVLVACSQPVATPSRSLANTNGANAGGISANPKNADGTPLSGASAANDSEAVSIPSSISGALLHCAIASDPAIVEPLVVVGCLFKDDGGKRIPVQQIAKTTVFSFDKPKGSLVPVSVQPLVDTSDYDVAYFFDGKDKEESTQVAKETVAKVAFKDLLSGDADKGISVKIGNILETAIAYIKELKAKTESAYATVSLAASDAKDSVVAGAGEAKDSVVNGAGEAKDSIVTGAISAQEAAAKKAAEIKAAADKKAAEAEEIFKNVFGI